ncbi:MAG: 50S ribosomal protein L4 [Candidatus Nealsonbacteria bacterium]|nr:50S ribosomal protein L4 [Candidatus Nealsonbacteria bacterium]
MKAPVFDKTGKEIKQVLLPKEIFGVKMNTDLVHQVVLAQTANRRRVIAHTKDRSEVRGGGKKPWRQKGTGRARHGSTRSPIWVGGGVTFGPTKNRVFKQKINSAMRKKALLMVLSAKAEANSVLVLDDFKLEAVKTKTLAKLIEKLPLDGKSALIILPAMDKNIILSARNLPKISTIQGRELNVLDVMTFKYLMLPQESIKVIKETLWHS